MTLEKIKSILGDLGFVDKPDDMAPYLSAWRGGWKGKAMLVGFPTSTQQVSELVKVCTEERIPIVPQGGNTGLVGASVPSDSGEELVINLSRMKKIRDIDTVNFTLTAEAGCILSNIQEAAKDVDRLFPISMGSEGSCEIGGIVSTNGGGTSVLHYGTTRDLVLGLEVVLPDGSVWDGLRTLRKNNTGYDLKQLFIGAEGTLGIVTAASFKLFPLPRQKETAFVAIPNMHAALELLSRFRIAAGDSVTAFELISATSLALVIRHIPETRHPCAENLPFYLLVELSSSQEGGILKTILEETLARGIESGLVADAVLAESLDHSKQFWHLRDSISEAQKKEGRGVHFDISLPISSIPAFIDHAHPMVIEKVSEATLVVFGHLGDGNLHYNVCLPRHLEDKTFEKHKKTLKDVVYTALREHGGSISAEHGIGVERKDDLRQHKSQLEMSLMHNIKQALDPLNLMNPGKIF